MLLLMYLHTCVIGYRSLCYLFYTVHDKIPYQQCKICFFLADMGPLIFEVVCGPSLKILGHARLDDVAKLSANAPIHG